MPINVKSAFFILYLVSAAKLNKNADISKRFGKINIVTHFASLDKGCKRWLNAVLKGETAEGKDVVGNEQKVAYIIEGGDAEDDVINGTDGCQAP